MNTQPRRKILVTDQSSSLADVVNAVAPKLDLDVKITSSGRELQESFVPFAPTVIALDLELADIPWFDLLYWISETTNPPKLLLVASEKVQLDTAVKLANAWQLPVIAALPKPVPAAALEKLLADVDA